MARRGALVVASAACVLLASSALAASLTQVGGPSLLGSRREIQSRPTAQSRADRGLGQSVGMRPDGSGVTVALQSLTAVEQQSCLQPLSIHRDSGLSGSQLQISLEQGFGYDVPAVLACCQP